MALPDQLDETVKYIKCLEKQLEKSKQRKEELLVQKNDSRKRPNNSAGCSNCMAGGEKSEPPQIQVLDTSPGMSVVLINGLESIVQFHDIIRVLHKQQGLEVANATFQIHGNSTLQVVHEQVGIYIYISSSVLLLYIYVSCHALHACFSKFISCMSLHVQNLACRLGKRRWEWFLRD